MSEHLLPPLVDPDARYAIAKRRYGGGHELIATVDRTQYVFSGSEVAMVALRMVLEYVQDLERRKKATSADDVRARHERVLTQKAKS